MGALTNPKTRATELSGNTKFVVFDNLTTTTATDTMILSAASNGISAIQNVIATYAIGLTATRTQVAATFSSLTVTLANMEQDGTAATAFGGVSLLVIGTG